MRRLGAALAAGVVATAAGAGAAAAQMSHGGAAGDVSILAASFAPAHLDVVAGDTVHWDNASVLRHTVTADDGSFGSGQLFGGEMYAHRFTTAGEVTYHCTVHPYMRGVVDIHPVLLGAPGQPGAPGRPYVLDGRSSLAAGDVVAIERDTGAGFARAEQATVGAGGAFSATVRAPATASFRAVTAGGEASPPVRLLIVDRKVTAAAGAGVVRVRVTPSSPGAVVVLQLRQRRHFGWWPVTRERIDRRSRATFSVPVTRRTRARVVLTLADGATVLASSPVLRVGPRARR
jgi:plastocyanin